MQPAATSAASSPPRCSSTRPRSTRRSRSASTTIPSRSPSCAGSTSRRTSASFRSCASRRAGRSRGARSIASRSRTASPSMKSPATALLEVRRLRTTFKSERGEVRAVDGVDFRLERGRTLGIVGESGCGKSVTALSIMGLVPQPPGRIAGGEVLFEGEDLLKCAPQRMRDLRGDKLAMIFQEPMTSLNPAFTVGDQVAETILRHRKASPAQARAQAIEMLRRVRIPSPERRARDYPHQLSGGRRERVMIAMALASNPQLLIADEPTTALDVTIQAQILELMRTLRAELGTAIVLITHDLGVIAELADEVLVMYAGQVIERCAAGRLFAEPQPPYTVGLLGSSSLPHVG